jgi:UDP-N-acetylglucosamine 4-epimerase
VKRAGAWRSSWERFRFVEGDIRCLASCKAACEGVDVVLHQAALGSVGRSIEDPILTSDINMIGFLNVLVAARDAGVRRLVYAASSATYGDHPELPKVEERIGQAPVALRADQARQRGVRRHVRALLPDRIHRPALLQCVRSAPGPGTARTRRSSRSGSRAMINNSRLNINGDGDSSRDFCFVDNAVQANLLASMVHRPSGSQPGLQRGRQRAHQPRTNCMR